MSFANIMPGGGTVTLTTGCLYTLTQANNATDGGTGLPVITGKVTIQGSGATIARSTAAGTPAFRLLDVASSGSLTLSSLTVSGGLANNGVQGGGGIYSHGTLSVTASTFTGNSSPATSGTSGGAIDSSGTLTVATSSFSGNSAQEGGGIFNQKSATISTSTFTNNTALIYGGGALLNAAGTETLVGDTFVGNTGPGGGAIDNDTALNVSNSTFFNNTGGGNGGGAVENFGTTTLTQSTFSGNSSPYGADIFNYTGFTLSMKMDIVANGHVGNNCGGQAHITDLGYNIDTGSSCGFSGTTGSMSNTQPNLDALASNGGPTQTMALPSGSPALNAIPASTAGCAGTTDQRGVARPQGSGCDVGAYELIVTTTDTQPPTVPTGLSATTVTSNSVGLSWSTSTDPDGTVVGYTIYRNGVAVGSTGGATTYTDLGVYPGTTYQYTVDAVDGGGNHSAQSSPGLSVTTTASGPIAFVQGASVSTGSQATSVTLQLGQPVGAGDLLVGWFGQYNSSGQVKVSDNVNGAWTRVTTASTTFGSGGDLAFYFLQNAKPSSGLTMTISATSATYLQGAVSEFSGVATSGAFDQAAAASGNGTSVASGATAAVGAGELVVGGIVTGGQPGTVTSGSSQGKSFVMDTHTSAGSADLEDIVSSAAGTQNATATITSSTDWHAGVAVFHQFSSPNPPPSVPSGLSAPTDTASSVGLSWTASTGATAYTIYRNGTQIGTSTTTTYTDSTVSPSTTYQYTVDAYNGAGPHSAQSSPALSVTTPATAPPVKWVQGGIIATGSAVASATVKLSSPVGAGDLLVGWVGQYNAAGQVTISDNVNGAWTRSAASTTFSNGGGDLALFYVQNSTASPAGLTITVTASSPTYLEAALAEYSGVATTGALDQTAVSQGNSASVDTGPTATVQAGELVVGGIITGGSPTAVTPGSTEGQPFVARSQTGSGSVYLQDVLVGAAGTQDARATFATATDWYAVVATFHTAA
ncbi:MAG TPA: fibronectin type III domain-containing protein [Acidimicrobiales bacterium]